MKRIILIMLGLFTMFTFYSCDKEDSPEEEDDCKQYYHYIADVTIEIYALMDGEPMAHEYYWYKVRTHKCGMEPTYQHKDGYLDKDGYIKIPLTYTFNFFNNHDYVEIEVHVFDALVPPYVRTIDYRDYNGIDWFDLEIQAVFNLSSDPKLPISK